MRSFQVFLPSPVTLLPFSKHSELLSMVVSPFIHPPLLTGGLTQFPAPLLEILPPWQQQRGLEETGWAPAEGKCCPNSSSLLAPEHSLLPWLCLHPTQPCWLILSYRTCLQQHFRSLCPSPSQVSHLVMHSFSSWGTAVSCKHLGNEQSHGV